MNRYRESGIEILLPRQRHFRFQDLATYRTLSARHLKEMDFAWCEADGTLVLLEVKAYHDWENGTGEESSHHENERWLERLYAVLVDKATDALFALLAAWAGTGLGAQLCGELPLCARKPPKRLRIVFGLDLPAGRPEHLLALRMWLRDRLAGRLTLAGAGRPEVVDYDTLRKRLGNMAAGDADRE